MAHANEAAPTDAGEVFSSYVRTQIIRYGVIAVWAIALAFAAGYQAAVIWAALAASTGMIRSAIEARLAKAKTLSYSSNFILVATLAGAPWAGAPLIAWFSGHVFGEVAAIAFIAAGYIMVFSQMRGSVRDALIITSTYSIVLLILAGDLVMAGGANVAIFGASIAVVASALVIHMVLAAGYEGRLKAYQERQQQLMREMAEQRQDLELELRKREGAERQLRAMIEVATGIMSSSEAMIATARRELAMDDHEAAKPQLGFSRDDDLARLVEGFSALVRELRLRDAVMRNLVSALTQAKRAADASSRAKSQFLLVVSHELRTPLNAVIGYTDLVIEEAQESELKTIEADATRVKGAASRLLAMIDAVLDITQLESDALALEISALDPASIFRERLEIFAPALRGKGVELQSDIDELGPMRGDGGRLRQCVDHLLSNATKFTAHGRIVVAARRDSVGADEMIVFSVRDSGCGFDQACVERLFEAFSHGDASTTRAQDGLGVGLAVARRLARLMGGDLVAEGAEGKGACFTLRVACDLPAATVKAPLAA